MAKANSPLDANLQQGFDLGYRNREDVTMIKPNILVSGSHDVLTRTNRRVGNRQGYVLDGQRDSSSSGAGIYGSFDWDKHNGTERNLRVGFNTAGNNGVLQVRYVATAGDKYFTTTFTEGQVYWLDLFNLMPLQTPDFCTFWDFDHELKDLMLFVNGQSSVFMWSGGITTIASTTATTITKNGGDTWSMAGFLDTGTYTQKVLINGTEYTYTGGADTGTLTGVTPNPTGEAVNSVAIQAVESFINASLAGLPINFKNSLIENLGNQVYISASDDNSVYVSKLNDFQDFTFSSPRIVGDGAILTLDGVPTALQQQGENMFVSAGKKFWYETQFTYSADNNKEALDIIPRKTTTLQAAQSQSLTTKIKNLIAFVSFETQINTFGISANFFTDPQVSDISYSIVNDVSATDFTDGQILYFNKYIFVTAPKEGVMFVYNMTLDMTDGLIDTAKHYWEAPQYLPFGKLSIIDGKLYGHSYESSNTFQLFVGHNDDGNPYKSIALFAYSTLGDRTATKSSNELFLEGYKTQNTVLTAILRRGLNGLVAKWSWGILPDRCLTVPLDDASIGKSPIGETSIGGTLVGVGPSTYPPKFRLVQTYPKVPYFEEQFGAYSDGIDQQWEICSFSTNATITTENQSSIYDPPLADIGYTPAPSSFYILLSGGLSKLLTSGGSSKVKTSGH